MATVTGKHWIAAQAPTQGGCWSLVSWNGQPIGSVDERNGRCEQRTIVLSNGVVYTHQTVVQNYQSGIAKGLLTSGIEVFPCDELKPN
jgi:hypothetical protein